MLLKLAKILIILVWMGFIYILSDIPCDSFPVKTTNAQQLLAHIFLFGVLSYFVIKTAINWQEEKKNLTLSWKLGLFAIIFSILYGISDEYHQGYVFGRFVSYIDLSFDAIGAVFGVLFFKFTYCRKRPKLLLHICCSGCGAYISRLLEQDYKVILYFYNPNIFPQAEYNKRLKEINIITKKLGLNIIIGEYNHDKWLKLIKGYEKEPEKGKRCLICYQNRLEATAKKAKEKKFAYFATTLTVSPHKDAQAINKIGNNLAKKLGVKFLDKDFKKKDGHKKSVEASRRLGLYRQDYCGCEYSKCK